MIEGHGQDPAIDGAPDAPVVDPGIAALNTFTLALEKMDKVERHAALRWLIDRFCGGRPPVKLP